MPTKRDYGLIAAAFREAHRTVAGIYPDPRDADGNVPKTERAQRRVAAFQASRNALQITEDHLTAVLKLDNPLFDKEKFELASGRRTADKGGAA